MSRRRGSRPVTRSFSFALVRRMRRLTFFSPSRVSVRWPVGLGSRPRMAASWTSDRDWMVPEEPTQVLKPFLRTASTAFFATPRIAFFMARTSLSEGGSLRANWSARRTTPSGRLSVRRTREPSEIDELGRTSPDVDQEERVLPGRELAAQRQVDEPGLLLSGDHLHPHPGALVDGRDELVGVGGLPDGAGRDGPDDPCAGAARQLDEAARPSRRPPRSPPRRAFRSAGSRSPAGPWPSPGSNTSRVPSSSRLATSSLMRWCRCRWRRASAWRRNFPAGSAEPREDDVKRA